MTVRCRPSLATPSSPWRNQWEVSLRLLPGLALKILLAPSISGLTSSQMTIPQGQYFAEHLGGIRRAHTGTSLCPMALMSQTGKRLVLSLSRTQCSCSPTVWTVPEASVFVVLLRNRREMNKERLKWIYFLENRLHFIPFVPSPG